MQDKIALTTNPAGMRLIAQMTIYNAASWDRLRQYISDSYSDLLLFASTTEDRVKAFTDLRSQLGRLRVGQVMALDKYHVVVLMHSETGDALQVHDLSVEAEHPHKIIEYKQYEIG